MLILRCQRPAEQQDKVLFVNGELLFKRGRNQNTLEPDHAETLLKAHQEYADQPGLAAVATLEDIKANGWNLNIPLYVEPAEVGEQITLEQALAGLETARAKTRETRAALEAELAKWGLGA